MEKAPQAQPAEQKIDVHVTCEQPQAKPSTLAKVTAIAAIASAVAAGTNVWVALEQRALARRQYVPQVALSIDNVQVSEPEVKAFVSVSNVGNSTIYDASASSGAIIAPAAYASRVFDHFGSPNRHVTLGPSEVHNIPFFASLPVEREKLSPKTLVVVGGKVVFFDDLGRRHERYICQVLRPSNGVLVRSYCATPAQF